MLSVDIGQVGRQFLEKRHGDRAAADEGPRFAAGQDFALDQQLAVLGFEARRVPAGGGWRRGRGRRRCRPRARATRRCGPFRPKRGRPAAAPARPPRSTCRCRSRRSAGSGRCGNGRAAAPPRRSSRPPVPAASPDYNVPTGPGTRNFAGEQKSKPAGLKPVATVK